MTKRELDKEIELSKLGRPSIMNNSTTHMKNAIDKDQVMMKLAPEPGIRAEKGVNMKKYLHTDEESYFEYYKLLRPQLSTKELRVNYMKGAEISMVFDFDGLSKTE